MVSSSHNTPICLQMSQHLPVGIDKTLETISGWLVTCQHKNKVPHEYTCYHYSNLLAPTTLFLVPQTQYDIMMCVLQAQKELIPVIQDFFQKAQLFCHDGQEEYYHSHHL